MTGSVPRLRDQSQTGGVGVHDHAADRWRRNLVGEAGCAVPEKALRRPFFQIGEDKQATPVVLDQRIFEIVQYGGGQQRR